MTKDLTKLSIYLKRSGLYSEYLRILKFASIEEAKDSLIKIESDLQNSLNEIKDFEDTMYSTDERYNSLIKKYDKLLNLSKSMLKMFDKMKGVSPEITDVIERIKEFQEIEGHNFLDNYKSKDKYGLGITEEFREGIDSFRNKPKKKSQTSHYDPRYKYSPCDDIFERKKMIGLKNKDEYLSYVGCLIMGNPTPEDVDFIYNIEDLKDLRGGYAVTPDVTQANYSKEEIQQNYKTLLSYNEKTKLKNILTNNKKDL